MPKSLTAKLTDLKIIQQLEQRIGRKLQKLDAVDDGSIEYVQNEQNQITGLGLYKCNLETFPPEICRLHNLTELHLKYNKLSILPAEIGRLHNLTHLDLCCNDLNTLTADIGQLHNLTNLDLSNNKLRTLPIEIGQLHNLTELNLSSNRLSTLPTEIGQLHNLTTLDLSENLDLTLPAEIGLLYNLTYLNLTDTWISSLPVEIGQLRNLTHLDLCCSSLSILPVEIGQLHNLTELNLGGIIGLSVLPVEIGHLHNLTKLDLGENELSVLPVEICQLHNLTELDLHGIDDPGTDYDKITILPAEIGQLRKLKRLDLSYNKLTQFPCVLLELNLEVKWDYSSNTNAIFVTDNPFHTPPVEIVKQGRQAIVDYYAAIERSKRPLHEAKLILIGDGAAGKTSLMKRLLEQPFDPQESQTHGININTLLLPDPHHNEIKLHCWDFGGQQIMHATHQFFLSKRCLYLLVIDSRRETQVEYWLKHIQAFGDNSPVIIVINKIDENPHFSLSPRQLTPLYPNLKHIHRISCRTNQGLTELKTTIQHTLPAIDLIHTMLPATWFNVKTAIATQAQHSNFASYEQYVNLCQQHGVYSDSEQTTLINFLHDLGIINHFPDRWLRETNVINPQWLTEAVYTIINAPHLAGNGKLHRKDLTTLLNPAIYPERKYDYILELMQKFELCYTINPDEFLLPDLFPVTEPNFSFDSDRALRFIVEYDFLPKSVFTRLVIKLHHEIVPDKYWRTGVLLHDATSNTTALIETTTNPNRITLHINGSQQQEYLAILRFMLQDINRRFKHLRITEKIGLPRTANLSVDYNYLLKLAENGQTHYIPPENPNVSYKLSELLGIVAPPTESELLLRLNKIIQMLEAQGFKEQKDLLDHIDEVVKINPSLFGVSVNVNALLKKMW